MKINCDLGESFGIWQLGNDERIMPFIDQANIACGFHGGDPDIMVKTTKLAVKHGVSIGAHPSYPDRQGFGRRSIAMSQNEVESLLLYQVSALDGIAHSFGRAVDYVKPHGALYNDMMKDAVIREGIFKAMARYHRNVPLMIQSTRDFAELEQQASFFGIVLLAEVFADRLYADDGRLVSRTHHAALHNLDKAVEQVDRLVNHGEVMTETGQSILLRADSICLHGDTPYAAQLAVEARRIVGTC